MEKIVKLFRQKTQEQHACVQIYANNYSCSLEHIKSLVDELRKDFPLVKDKDIQVQKFGGQRVKGITFVEAFFSVPTKVPEGYQEISMLEYVL